MGQETLLSRVRIASPCPMAWSDMEGDERKRFCQQCQLNVYNLSDMTQQDAESLLVESEGRLCVTYYQRADGTILTRNCPVGLRLARKAAAKMVGCVAAVIGLLLTLVSAFGATARGQKPMRLSQVQPFKTVQNWLMPTPPPALFRRLGEVCVMPRPGALMGRIRIVKPKAPKN